MKTQDGFTIVELMIVVGVISIIASLAIPLYSDYMTRGKVSEPVLLLGGLRTPMTEYYSSNGIWPDTVDRVGGKQTGKYVDHITTGEHAPGIFFDEAVMKDSVGWVSNKRLRNYYYADTGNWECTTNGAADPIQYQYLPSSCK
jgi:type IV pilus assembly protein PilA